VPVVLFNRLQDDESLSGVASDNLGGGRKLAEFLVAGGHRKIAHIAGWEGASTQRDREQGFLSGLHAAGMALHSRAVGNFHADQAQVAARILFDTDDRPDAVFVANDHMAFAVMDVLRYELGLRVPQDVSVVGYDDVTIAAWPSYDLTTVRQPANRMVEETVRTMLYRIESPDAPARRVAIDGPLIVRGSARIPEGWKR
jgi:LacI family transcriptional regulator